MHISKRIFSVLLCVLLCAPLQAAAATHTHTLQMRSDPPTCTESGRQYQVCIECGAILDETATDPALGHDYGDWESADDDMHTRRCSRCEDVETAPHNKIEDHSRYRNPTVDSTGLRVFVCAECGEAFYEILPKLDHTHIFTSQTFPATCTENGRVVYTCTICEAVSVLETESALGHDYDDGEVLREESCTQDGLVIYTCLRCGEQTEEIMDAYGHAFGTGIVTTEPTCTADGVRTFTCTRCGATQTENIRKLDHNYNAVVTEPTCTEGGFTTYTCSMCGDAYTADPTDALGHLYDSGEITTEPTCTAEGVRTFTCTRCGTTRTKRIPKSNHSYNAAVTEPTCTKGGFTTYTCSMCSDSYTADETDARGHEFNDGTVTTEPTCAAEGVRTFTCTRCGMTQTESIPTLPHDYGAVVTEPTCTKGGFTTYTCSMCSDTYTADETDARGHEFNDGTVTTEPTCAAEGVRTFICTRCGATQTENVPTLPHDYGAVVTEPTCTKGGFTTFTCSMCGDTYTADQTDALGHVPGTGKVTIAPTCSAEGLQIFTCTRCGVTQTETIARTDHRYSTVVTLPTCTEGGFTVYTCILCGDAYTAQETAPYGHSFGTGSITTLPTCASEGVHTAYCSRCGAERTTPIPKTAHIFGPWRCTVQPTYTSDGKEVRQCTVCALTETRPVPRLEKEPLTIEQTQITLLYRETAYIATSEPVTWSSSDMSVAYANTDGYIVTTGSGTAVLTAVSQLDDSTAACTVTVRYAWWQTLIRIFLFGFLWY